MVPHDHGVTNGMQAGPKLSSYSQRLRVLLEEPHEGARDEMVQAHE